MHNRGAVAAFGAGCILVGVTVVIVSPSRSEERASFPSVRTEWSSPNETQRLQWFAFHNKLVAESIKYTPSSTGGGRVVLIGDSQIEQLRGTSYGKPLQ